MYDHRSLPCQRGTAKYHPPSVEKCTISFFCSAPIRRAPDSVYTVHDAALIQLTCKSHRAPARFTSAATFRAALWPSSTSSRSKIRNTRAFPLFLPPCHSTSRPLSSSGRFALAPSLSAPRAVLPPTCKLSYHVYLGAVAPARRGRPFTDAFVCPRHPGLASKPGRTIP